jgi:hypothetical protein
VKPTLFLRIASVLAMIHCILHTLGGVFGTPKHGAEEIAVVDAMKSHFFNFMGSLRSYWDFQFGYGLFVTVALFIHSLLFWYLGSMAKTGSPALRPILALFFVNYIGFAILAWKYFFLGPAVTELLIAACLGLAFATAATAAA